MKVYYDHVKGCTCKMAVRRCPVDYIVFYSASDAEPNKPWIIERVSDKVTVERGLLEDMMTLVQTEDGSEPKYPNGRRAHLGEDILRNPPRIFSLEYKYR